MKHFFIHIGLTISFNLWATTNKSCLEEAEQVIGNYLYDIQYHCLDETVNWQDKECISQYHKVLEEDLQDYYDLCVNSTNG